MSHRQTDVLVIGGGIIGLSCAYFLLERGRSVRICESEQVGGGSSCGNCGLITPSHAAPVAMPGMVGKALRWMLNPRSPFYVRPTLRPSIIGWLLKFASQCNDEDMVRAMAGRSALLNSSRQLYEPLLDESRIHCEWEARGVLMVYKTGKAMHAFDSVEKRLADFGVTSRSYIGSDLQVLEPALRKDVYGARLYPYDAHIRPDRLVTEMHRLVRSRGAIVEENCPVQGFDAGPHGVEGIRSKRGRFRAGEYVMASGAWTPAIAKQAGLGIPIQPGKGYTITMGRPSPCPAYPCILHEKSIAVTPWASGYRLGGTMEFAGYSSGINRKRIGAIIEGAGNYLRAPTAEGRAEEWFGWRPMTYDGLPFIGRSPKHNNLIVAAGHGMMGVSMAPATGRLVSEIIAGIQPHIDPSPYRLNRAAG